MRATGSRRWLPRRTIRLRLTLLYGGLFLVAGAGLLAITYALVAGGGPESKSVFVSNPVPAGAGQLPTVPPGFGKAAPGAGTASGTVIYQQKTPLGTVVQFRAYEGKVNATFKQVSSALRSVTSQANEQIAEVRGAQLSTLLTESAIALGIMALASIGLGWLMAGRALRPVRTMSTRARGISERNLHERLSLEGPDDELKELAETFDGLLGRLESAFESQRRFVANASHELRTPITLERALVEVALADPHPTVDSLRDTCQRVLVASEQQERLIEALLTLARSQRGVESRGPVDLRAVTAEVVQRRASQRAPGRRGTRRRVRDWRSGHGRAARGQPDRERGPPQPAGRLGQCLDRRARRGGQPSRSPTPGRSSTTLSCPSC